jgi:hypothetical protein
MGLLGLIEFDPDTCGFKLSDIVAALGQVDGILDSIALGNPFQGSTTSGTNNDYTTSTLPTNLPMGNNQFVLFKANRTNTSASIATLNVNAEGAKKVYVYNNTGLVTTKGGEIRNTHHYLARKETALDSGAGGWVLMNPSLAIPTTTPALSANVATVFTAITWDEYNISVDEEFEHYNIGVRFTMAAPLPTQIYINLPHASVANAGLNAAGNVGYEVFAREAGATLAAKVIHWCDTSARLRFVKESGAGFAAGAAALFVQGRVRTA